jgi:hypothetical protein
MATSYSSNMSFQASSGIVMASVLQNCLTQHLVKTIFKTKLRSATPQERCLPACSWSDSSNLAIFASHPDILSLCEWKANFQYAVWLSPFGLSLCLRGLSRQWCLVELSCRKESQVASGLRRELLWCLSGPSQWAEECFSNFCLCAECTNRIANNSAYSFIDCCQYGGIFLFDTT